MKRKTLETDENTRIAIVNTDKCKPNKCGQECKKKCPINKSGKQCVVVEKTSKKTEIAETLCTGCGICIKMCPFDALRIINLPKGIPTQTIHRYGKNMFKLYRLPSPKVGQVLGIVGKNGIGKSTALQILTAKQIKPNLGKFDDPPQWQDILKHFRGTELQSYFTKCLEENFKTIFKPQYVDQIPKQAQGKVGDIIKKKDERGTAEYYIKEFQMEGQLEREVKVLSGGELQRFAILVVQIREGNVYMIDEPATYLDVRQRLIVSNKIREMTLLNDGGNYVIVVEHDLSILDYLSDLVCILYGQESAYGVVTMPIGVREGINAFLEGFIQTENMRFRDEELTFKIKDNLEEEVELPVERLQYEYPAMKKKLGNFELTIHEGQFSNSQIIVQLGENGTGKTTFVKILAGLDKEQKDSVPELKVSFKPQTIAPKFEGTVKDLLYNRIRNIWETNILFKTHVYNQMHIEPIENQEVQKLSGGELQRVALVLALGKKADVYLIDEPSAFLDCEQRIVTAKSIKRFIMHCHKTAFIVEHDFIMATYQADKVIVYEGSPGEKCTANTPLNLVEGMNKFLSILGVTFRRDPSNFRPRINKLDSQKDQEQKANGNYFSSDN